LQTARVAKTHLLRGRLGGSLSSAANYPILIATVFAFWLLNVPRETFGADVARLSALIDEQVSAGWKRTRTKPAALSSDEEFLRRIYLDITGRIPTRAELHAFLASTKPDKRRTTIDQLLASDEFVAHWADNLNAMLQGPTAFPMTPAWERYLRGSLAAGKGWDQIARELILARPSGEDTLGAVEFLGRRFSAPEPLEEVTRDVTRVLFGVDMQCARCHVHPEVLEWKPESYWGMAAFFNRTYSIQIGSRTQLAERARVDVPLPSADKKSRVAEPRFMTGARATVQTPPPVENATRLEQRKKANPDAPPGSPLLDNPGEYHLPPAKNPLAAPLPLYSRRQALVDLAVNSDNTYFAPAIVNRVWAWMLGRGLVEPLDQMHAANPPSHPELLTALSKDFALHGYDFRRLVAGIAGSRTYQLASTIPGATPAVRPATERFAVADLRPLSQHQYALALFCAVGELDRAGGRAKLEQKESARIARYLKELDSGTEHFQPSLQVSLFLANSSRFDDLIANGGLARRLSATADEQALIQLAFESILSRHPDREETSQMVQFLAARRDRRSDACKQVVWSLLNTSEFRFNH
jgi:hypothetical protein